MNPEHLAEIFIHIWNLNEVGGEHLAPVAVVEGEGGGEAGGRHPQQHCLAHHTPPRSLYSVQVKT